jgi:hypothetical protein
MPDPDEPAAEDELPMPPRPAAEVLVPPLRPPELRQELQRLEDERERALQEIGGLVVDMAGQGALSPALLADRAAGVRSRQDQIDAITTALGGKRLPPRTPTRRATVLAALLAVGVLGAVAGAWIERRHDDTAAVPVATPAVVTQTVVTTAPAATVTVPVVTPSAKRAPALERSARGGRAVVRGR